jgi:glycosyltransferase involved in cell wall biosynthesis
MGLPSLSIVIPCYNEAKNIPLIVARFREIAISEYNVEVVLVNNGSTDDTIDVLQKEIRDKENIFTVVTVFKNRGYGHGILSGLAKAKGDVLAWTHADMQTDPLDVFKAFDKYVQSGLSMAFVKGARRNRAIVPYIFTTGMGVFASLALGIPLRDIGAQPKLFGRDFYNQYLKDRAPEDFSLDLYAQYWAAREGKIEEIPVYFAKRVYGEAKGGGSLKTRIKVTIRVIKFILKMRRDIKAGK